MQVIKLKINKPVEVFGQDVKVDGIINVMEIVMVDHINQFIQYRANSFASEEKIEAGEPLVIKTFHQRDQKRFRFDYAGRVYKQSVEVSYNSDGTLTEDSLTLVKEQIKEDLASKLEGVEASDIE
jgi:hypothetical protein